MKNHLRFLWLLVYLLTSFPASVLFAQSAQQANLIEGARKEGKLVWYTSMAIDLSKPLLDAFTKEYPFIKGDLVRAGNEQLTNRVFNETRAGKWGFDLISISSADLFVERGILAPYFSSERGAFIDEFKDSRGYWTSVYNSNLVLMYNTRLVREKEAPRDYADLLDPKWKGKMLMDSTDYEWFGTLAVALGKEKTAAYMKQLARQDLIWRRGHGLVAQLVGAGELPLGWAYTFRVERMKKDGAPVDWVDTFDPIMSTAHGMGYSSKATNPNAAKLFIDFALSKRSQQMIRDMRLVPSRRDVEPLVPKMDQNKLKIKRIPREVSLNVDLYAKEFREIFGI
jgi:iron(III) transport system substrate-binding protein